MKLHSYHLHISPERLYGGTTLKDLLKFLLNHQCGMDNLGAGQVYTDIKAVSV